MKNIKYSKGQKEFLNNCLDGENLFLTGKAGTGKSYIVLKAIKRLKNSGKKVIVLGPTGIAANNVGGQTIHSLFQLPIYGIITYDDTAFLRQQKRKVLKEAEVILIDEISMVRPDMLDAMNWTLIKNGLGFLEEKQIIFIGDLKQLPSPIDDNSRSILLNKYDGVLFSDSKVYKGLNVKTIELKKIHRQKDPEFIKSLNIVRDGGKSPYFRQFITSETSGIVLAPHNSTVSSYNIVGLNSIDSKLCEFKARYTGKASDTEFNMEDLLKLKDGCKIMYLVNSKNNPLYNGTIGIFRIKENGTPFIEVKGQLWEIEPVTQDKKEYVFNEETNEIDLVEIGSMTQLPIKLAYALTIHKSQGLTFDKVTVDLTRSCFASGQLYTALSRVKSPEGLHIKI